MEGGLDGRRLAAYLGALFLQNDNPSTPEKQVVLCSDPNALPEKSPHRNSLSYPWK